MKLVEIWVVVARDDYLAWQSRVGALCKLHFFFPREQRFIYCRKIYHTNISRVAGQSETVNSLLFVTIEIFFEEYTILFFIDFPPSVFL